MQTFFQKETHKSHEYLAQMPALHDKTPSDFPDLQSPPEDENRKSRCKISQQIWRLVQEIRFEHNYISTCLNFIATYLPTFCVFDCCLGVFNVVVQDKGHSLHSIKYDL